MKLLSVMLTPHDSNMSYYDGNVVRYHKLERSKQIKRYGWDDAHSWARDLKQIWDISLSDVDEIACCVNYQFTDIDSPNSLPELITVGEFFPAVDIRKVFPNDNLEWMQHSKVSLLNHHYCHALSTWMLNQPDICIVIDGLGDSRSWSVFNKDKLIDSGHIKEFGSIGWAMKDYGFGIGLQANHANDLAGKLMGLQSYGNIDKEYYNFLKNQNYNIQNINDIFSLNHWLNHKGHLLLAKLTQLDHIKTVHHYMGEVLVNFFKKYASASDTIGYSGGVAQNVIWNTVLRQHFPKLIIPPHSSDEGLSLGGLEFLRRKNNLPKFKLDNFPYIESDESPDSTPTLETIRHAAKLLANGKTVGWYQGHGEVGPRALGNRSILMNPCMSNGRNKINEIKNREQFRPFGASVLKAHTSTYFETDNEDPYMLYVANVRPKYRDQLESITHVDNTCRIQTVDDRNPIYKQLLTEFYNLTGVPILLNTSLNIAGKPIAGYLENARELFYTSKIDAMFIGDQYLLK